MDVKEQIHYLNNDHYYNMVIKPLTEGFIRVADLYLWKHPDGRIVYDQVLFKNQNSITGQLCLKALKELNGR